MAGPFQTDKTEQAMLDRVPLSELPRRLGRLPPLASTRCTGAGEDLTAHLDLAKATRPGREVQGVNVDFPVDLLRAIDREAKRIGATRQAFIKLRLTDTLASSH